MSNAQQNAERRRFKRRDILDTFSFFVSIPKKGPHRLKVHDVSDLGLRFDLDDDGERPEDFPAKIGDALKIRLYVNQSLYIPVDIKIARLETKDGRRQVGAETAANPSAAQTALSSLLQIIDQLSEITRVDEIG